MKFRKFLGELQRRNVIKAVIAYLAVAWILVQIASTLFPVFDVPPILMKGLIILLSIGLIFWVGFSWMYDLTPSGFLKTDSADYSEDTHKRNDRRLNFVIVTALTVGLLFLLGASFWAGSQWAKPDSQEALIRIAVTPLIVEKGISDEEILESGFTSALIDEMAQIKNVKVMSLASSQFLKAGFLDNNEFIQEEAEEIDYFISGRITKQNTTLELDLLLSKSLAGRSVFKKNYKTDISGIRAFWRDIAEELALELGLPSSEFQTLKRAGITSVTPETYELYLKGKYYLNRSTVADWQKGIVYFEEAVNKNPADPHAYAGLAEAYITLGHSLNPPIDVFPKALAAAKRAIQLDSLNAEGWAALSHYHTYFGWDWALADYAYLKANSLNPNMAYNHYHRAWYLALFGRMDEAIEAHKRAQEIDPFSSMHTSWLGKLYQMVGEHEKALEEVDKAAEMFDDNALSLYIRGQIYYDMGNEQAALENMKKAAEINSGWKYMGYGELLFQTGNFEAGMEIINELEQLEETPFFSLCLAGMYFNANDYDTGFQWLEKAKGHAFYPWIRVLNKDEKLQSDPRYLQLIDELGLPDPAPLSYSDL